MGLLLNPLEGTLFLKRLKFYGCPNITSKFFSYFGKSVNLKKYPVVVSSSQGSLHLANHSQESPEYKVDYFNKGESESIPYVQTLREFPKEELASKVVMLKAEPK